MKNVLIIVFLSFTYSVSAQPCIFHLKDLADKINSGMTADQYRSAKANASLAQAKAANAPLEAQKEIKQWVAIACSLDIIDKTKRINAK